MNLKEKTEQLKNIDPIKDYDTWCKAAYDKFYFDQEGFKKEVIMPIHKEFIESVLNFFEGCNIKKVLVAAGGQGTMVKILKDKGYDAFGIDISEYAISLAKKRFPDIADKLFIMDIKKMDLFQDKGFDLIISSSTLEHIPWDFIPQIAKEFARLSRYIYVMAAFDHRYDNDYTHMPIHTMQEYTAIFKEHFEWHTDVLFTTPNTLPGERWDHFIMKRKEA